MNSSERIWMSKVLAWIHDPPEKALVLFNAPEGHEGGTSNILKELVFKDKKDILNKIRPAVMKGDHWASAADRIEMPKGTQPSRTPWNRINFMDKPVLIHPLSGEQYNLREPDLTNLRNIELENIKRISEEHLKSLVVQDDKGDIDYRLTFLQFWRFGPVLEHEDLKLFWNMLPADTRVPDHSIWEHLKLTSAFASIFALGDVPALLKVSIGPVQSFIAQARSTSDLWAGSHLLSRMTWEAMKYICETCGPDSIVFPDLHGIPIVDVWLAEQGVDFDTHEKEDWMQFASDMNPLFSAALPNQFLAVVPSRDVDRLTSDITSKLRLWIREKAEDAWRYLCGEVDPNLDIQTGLQQINMQLSGFPEIYWVSVPWTLIDTDTRGNVSNTEELEKVLGHFYPNNANKNGKPGFLGHPAWRILFSQTERNTPVFFDPNPGTLYPAMYDLTNRVMDAKKNERVFRQFVQEGFRCSLCGEREWLTIDRSKLKEYRGPGRMHSPWDKISAERPSWARAGEHLCAICLLKRLWPALFRRELVEKNEQLKKLMPDEIRRYVVSTHTMALAKTMESWIKKPEKTLADDEFNRLESFLDDLNLELNTSTALPLRLAHFHEEKIKRVLHQVPSALDELKERIRSSPGKDRELTSEKLRTLQYLISKSGAPLENYYAFILMDGDRMGAWLSGTSDPGRPPLQNRLHPDFKNGFINHIKASAPIRDYVEKNAPVSPAYHAAISRCLNGFSMKIVKRVVEELFLGKVIYAGGDDLLAMAAAGDLLRIAMTLRCAYSGMIPAEDEDAVWNLLRVETAYRGMKLGGGHVLLNDKKRLYRMMGQKATASMGAVIAHHMAPVGTVLRRLRQAEQLAKQSGRDAFSIFLVKRGGGETRLTCGWHLNSNTSQMSPGKTAPGVLLMLQDCIVNDLSRRGVYHVIDRMKDFPTDVDDLKSYREMLIKSVAYQFKRQSRPNADKEKLAAAAENLVDLALAEHDRSNVDIPSFLIDTLTVVEFMSREARIGRRRS